MYVEVHDKESEFFSPVEDYVIWFSVMPYIPHLIEENFPIYIPYKNQGNAWVKQLTGTFSAFKKAS
jgi:hypothetical protein